MSLPKEMAELFYGHLPSKGKKKKKQSKPIKTNLIPQDELIPLSEPLRFSFVTSH
jgi:hypothetical protein